MSEEDERGGARLLRGYLPAALVALLVTVAVVVVTRGGSDDDDEDGNDALQADEQAVGQTASGWGDTVQACQGQEWQTEDSYAPPCFEFDGDNGGPTADGVDEDSITISFRTLTDVHIIDLMSKFAGNGVDGRPLDLGETPEDLVRTVEGLVEYFNENYDFYGRDLELETFEGSGQLVSELQNAGQEEATNDALQAQEAGAFADVFSISQPYAEALTRNGIVNIGAPYMSREWFNEGDRATLSWSNFPDCTQVSEVTTDLGIARILNEPAAFAGEEFRDGPRRLGVVVPSEEQYQLCRDNATAMLDEAGIDYFATEYPLDLTAGPEAAANLLPQLVDEGVTSVACGCDPLMLRALLEQADQAGYEPEWFILGTAFVDWDLVGQMLAAQAPNQWARAFGGTPTGEPVPFEETEGYRAYTSVRDDEPSQIVDLLFSQMYRLAIGVQMAGPELTPETFANGLFNYPARTGFDGTWDFSPENHSGIADARFIVWDPDAISPFNGRQGAYVSTGDRFTEVEETPTQQEIIEQYGDQFGLNQ